MDRLPEDQLENIVAAILAAGATPAREGGARIPVAVANYRRALAMLRKDGLNAAPSAPPERQFRRPARDAQDEYPIKVICPQCGGATETTVGWLKTHREFECSPCGTVVAVDPEKLVGEIGAGQKAVDHFMRLHPAATRLRK